MQEIEKRDDSISYEHQSGQEGFSALVMQHE